MNSKTKATRNNENRDPLTCEPGSHPIGTGTGAIAGGVAGAGIGAAGGPIGSAVGAATGAIVGGLGGHAAAEKFNPTKAGDLERFLDYTVVDRTGNKVGTVDSVWEDHTGQPYYVAVRTGWLHMGKAHIVPAQGAEVNEQSRKIRLPYDAELMKNAPTFDCQSDITKESEATIHQYFGNGTCGSCAPSAKSEGVEETRMELKTEDVKIGKRQIEYGGIRLRKIIRTEVVFASVKSFAPKW
jgi:hypothetical protein